MTAADEAYEAAVKEIRRVQEAGEEELRLDRTRYQALARIPVEIADLTGVKMIDLDRTSVADLTPIASMTWLESLSLSQTRITDLSLLRNLTSLQYLAVDGTGVSDISSLSGITGLRTLWLSGTAITDLSPMVGLTALNFLSLDGTAVTDISPLGTLVELRNLHLENTAISDLSTLAKLTSLQVVWLFHTSIADISPLADLKELETLWLGDTAVVDVAPLSGLPRLTSLLLNGTRVANLSSLVSLTSLKTLWLDQTPVVDLSPIAALTELQALRVDQTAVTDLSPLAGLIALETLSLRQTEVTDLSPCSSLTSLRNLRLELTSITDLSPLANLASLKTLTLDGSLATDLRPLCRLSGLAIKPENSLTFWEGLRFNHTPATGSDVELARLAEIEDNEQRSRETLVYLNTLPPWPEPLPWQPPPSVPDAPPPPPDPDQLPQVDISPEGLDLASSPIAQVDLSDPIKARLYAKLPDAAATLLRHGNRYPEVAGPARELVSLTSVAFDSADLLDIHLQLAALTDVRTADADRPLLERLDPDCRTALDAVLRIGPGVTLGHPDVDALEVRLAEYARLRQPATVAEGERRVTGALAERKELATERLRKVAGQVSKAGDEGRLPEYRRGFSRNVIIALGAVASGLTEATQGYVYGEIAIAAAHFLVLHRDAIIATAPAWGQTGYAWLEYILVRADLILRDAKSGHLNKQ
jgi:internalin A